MENIDLQQIMDMLARLSIPGVVGLIVIALWKGGILESLATWIRKSPESGVAREFQEFKTVAETNHYTDLKSLLDDRERIWEAIDELRRNDTQNTKNIAYIMGRLKNGHIE